MNEPKLINFTEDTAMRMYEMTMRLLVEQKSEELGIKIKMEPLFEKKSDLTNAS